MHIYNLNLSFLNYCLQFFIFFEFGGGEDQNLKKIMKNATPIPPLPLIDYIFGLDCAWGLYFLFLQNKIGKKTFLAKYSPAKKFDRLSNSGRVWLLSSHF